MSFKALLLLCSLMHLTYASDNDNVTANEGIEQYIHICTTENYIEQLKVSNDELAIYAFNVGQANFVALTKNNKAVIVDAGFQDKRHTPQACYNILQGHSIEAIYITHPHADHYSFIFPHTTNTKTATAYLSKLFDLGNTLFLLGGAEADWDTGFVMNIRNYSYAFLNHRNDTRIFLDNVIFRVFGTAPVAHREDKNKLSLLLQVQYANKKALFLGDAEGDSISRLFLRSYNIGQFSYFFDGECKAQIDSATNQLNSYITKYITNNFCGSVVFDDAFVRFAESYCKLYQDINNIFGKSILDISHAYALNEYDTNDTLKNLFLGQFIDVAQSSHEAMINFIDDVIDFIAYLLQKYSNYYSGVISHLESCDIQDTNALYTSLRNAAENGEDSCRAFLNIFIEEIQEQAQNDNEFLSSLKDEFLSHFTYNAKDIVASLVHILAIRKIFKASDVIYLPHHGSNTNCSQNFLGLFAGSNRKHLFIVSSSPFGKDQLPKASTFEMASSAPEMFAHPFLYCRDYTNSRGKAQFVMTKKPIFLTGAAPGGVIAVKFTGSLSGSVHILNTMKNNNCLWQCFQ